MTASHRVVIVGGGFGGLAAVSRHRSRPERTIGQQIFARHALTASAPAAGDFDE